MTQVNITHVLAELGINSNNQKEVVKYLAQRGITMHFVGNHLHTSTDTLIKILITLINSKTIISEHDNNQITPTNNEIKLYTKKETSQLLKCSVRHLDRLIARGHIKSVKIGGRILIAHDHILEFITQSIR